MVNPSSAPRPTSLPTLGAAGMTAATKPVLAALTVGMPARQVHALLVAANLFWYQATRQCLGLLVVAMANELKYTTSQKGRLIAAPSVGNIVTQLLGGLVEAQLGARTTIGVAIVGMAAGVSLVPLACSSSHALGMLVLAAQGFLFGPMFPSHSVLLSRWLPPNERGAAMAQGELAISLASMGVPLVLASVETAFGWRAGFYGTGIACAAYLLVWLNLAASRPNGADAPSWRVLTHSSVIALYICHMVYNLTTLSINSWMPSYYAEVLNTPPDQAKLHLTLPHLAALGLKLIVSSLAAALRARAGLSMLASRRAFCAIGFALTALPLALLPLASDVATHPVWHSTFLFSLALVGTGFHAEGFRANYLDVTAKHVGLVSGLGNCLSSVAAMGAPLLVGAMVQHFNGQWGPVWYASSAACVAAAGIFGAFATTTPVELTLAGKKTKAKAA